MSQSTTVGPVPKLPPCIRGSKPTTENWHPMWGLWLVVGTPEAHKHPAAAACQPTSSRPQSHMKIISFSQNNTSKHMTFQQLLTGWLWQCATPSHSATVWLWWCMTPSHSATQMGPCAWGLCPYNIRGHARGGIEDQEQFLQRLDNSDNEGAHRFLPKKSGHLQNEGETDQDDCRETLTLHSGHFVVPGAHDFDWVLGAPNFV